MNKPYAVPAWPARRTVPPLIGLAVRWACALTLSGAAAAHAGEPIDPVDRPANPPARVLSSDPAGLPEGKVPGAKTLSSARARSSRPPAPAVAPAPALVVTPIIAPQIQLPATPSLGTTPPRTPSAPVLHTPSPN